VGQPKSAFSHVDRAARVAVVGHLLGIQQRVLGLIVAVILSRKGEVEEKLTCEAF